MTSMTFERARKLLGEEISVNLSDEDSQELMGGLEILANMTIKAIIKGEFKILPDEAESSSE